MFNYEEKEYELPLYDSPEEHTVPEKFECSDEPPYHPRFSRVVLYPPPPPPHYFHDREFNKRGKKGNSTTKKVVIGSTLALAGFSFFTLGRLYEGHSLLQNMNTENFRGFRTEQFGEEYPHELPCGSKHHKPKHYKPKHHKSKHHKEHNETNSEEISRAKYKAAKLTELNEDIENKDYDMKFRSKEYRQNDDDDSDFSNFSDDEEENHKKFEGNKHERPHREDEDEQVFNIQEEHEERPKHRKLYGKVEEHDFKSEEEHREKPKHHKGKHYEEKEDFKKHKGDKPLENLYEEFKGNNDLKGKHHQKLAQGKQSKDQPDMLSEMEEIYTNVKESIDNIAKNGFSLTSN